jgi:membrane protein DedA with SNARE-associated domain
MEAFVNLILNTISHWGLPAIFLLMTLSSMCIPIPSEVVLLFSGYLVFQGKLGMFPIIAVSLVGNVVGSVIAYYIGLIGGRPLFLKYGKYVFVKERELDWAENWFAKVGHETVFFGRMVPMIRAFISVPAGVAEMNFAKFNIYTFLGSVPWSIGLAYAGYALGAKWQTITSYFTLVSVIALIIVLAGVAYFIYAHLKRKNG